jgi:hypothetical protein
VWRLGREGVLPRIKLEGRKYVRFAEEDVERLVREGRQVGRSSGDGRGRCRSSRGRRCRGGSRSAG